MQFKLAAFLLLAVPSIFAAPVAEPEAAIQDVSSAIEDPYAELIERQLGGGPSGSPAGTSWGRTWKDTSLLEPNGWKAVRGSGCSYGITFNRDPRDAKYNLAYYSVFGSGELESQEKKTPINIGYRGSTDSSGRRQYYGLIEDACSTFYTSRPAPRGFKIYFTPKSGQGSSGYISPIFN